MTFSFALVSALGFVSPAVDPATATDWWSVLRRTQSAELLYVLASARNIYSDTDFYSTPLDGYAGILTGTRPQPPFIGYGYRTNQTTKAVRPGQKRIAGMYSGQTDNGGVLEPGARALGEAFADAMSTALAYNDEGQPIALQPAICGRQQYITPNGTKAYKYYDTEAEQMAHTATSMLWSLKPTVRTQVSRQYGRGV